MLSAIVSNKDGTALVDIFEKKIDKNDFRQEEDIINFCIKKTLENETAHVDGSAIILCN